MKKNWNDWNMLSFFKQWIITDNGHGTTWHWRCRMPGDETLLALSISSSFKVSRDVSDFSHSAHSEWWHQDKEDGHHYRRVWIHEAAAAGLGGVGEVHPGILWPPARRSGIVRCVATARVWQLHPSTYNVSGITSETSIFSSTGEASDGMT